MSLAHQSTPIPQGLGFPVSHGQRTTTRLSHPGPPDVSPAGRSGEMRLGATSRSDDSVAASTAESTSHRIPLMTVVSAVG